MRAYSALSFAIGACLLVRAGADDVATVRGRILSEFLWALRRRK
jgi:hypothetical protein